MADAEPITGLIVNGSGLTLDVARSITELDIDETTEELSSLVLTVRDEGFDLLRSGLFAKGASVTYAGLDLAIAQLATTDDRDLEHLKVTCYNRGVIALQSEYGELTYDGTHTDFLSAAAARVGLKFHGQADPGGSGVFRSAIPGQLESTWDVVTQAANQLGFWLFESAGTLCFGKPSWLLQTTPRVATIGWRGSAGADRDSIRIPACERYDIPGQRGITEASVVEVSVPIARAEKLRAGLVIEVSGVPGFKGRYLLAQNHWQPGTTEPAELSLVQAIDPYVQPFDPGNPVDEIDDANNDHGDHPPPHVLNPGGPFRNGTTAATLIDQARRALARWPFITTQNQARGLPQGLLLAVGSAETGLANVVSEVQVDGNGRSGKGHGVWQLDDRHHADLLRANPDFDNDVKAQCRKAAAMLQANFKRWGDWHTAVKRYNGKGPIADAYADDVLDRRQCLENNWVLLGDVTQRPGQTVHVQ